MSQETSEWRAGRWYRHHVDVAGLLLDLSDGVFARTWRRLEGLSDEEFLWEPAPNCWTVRERDGAVRADWAPYIGDVEVTLSGLIRSTRTGGDSLHPPPFTNIAWRLGHLTEVYGRAQNEQWLTGSTAAHSGVERAHHRSAGDALGALRTAHGRWRAVLASLTDAQLDEPLASPRRHTAGTTKAGHVLYMIDEFCHHGAELGVLRDLYAQVHTRDPLRESPPNLARVAWAGMWHAIPALIDAGADVNAESDGVTVLHLAAAAGESEVVERLLDHGADPLATQQARFFGRTPLQWAEHFGRVDVAAVLRERGGLAPE
jgi:hypothetical protein